MNPERFTGSFRALEAAEEKITAKLASFSGGPAKLVEPKSLARTAGSKTDY